MADTPPCTRYLPIKVKIVCIIPQTKEKKQPEKKNFRLFFTFWSANSESKDFPAKKSIPMKAPLHT